MNMKKALVVLLVVAAFTFFVSCNKQDDEATQTTDAVSVASADMSMELFDISELKAVKEIPAFAKKGIGVLTYCETTDPQSPYATGCKLCFNEVSAECAEKYVAYLEENDGKLTSADNVHDFQWDWGHIKATYYPGDSVLEVLISTVK